MNPAGSSVAKDDGGGEGEKFAAGKVYEVKLITGDEFKGIVMAYDPDSNFVEFEEGTKPKPGDVKTTRTVNANFITELKSLGKVEDPLAYTNCSIDLYELRLKESAAISEIERMGIGVTAEGKIIFDALSKTLPVEWDNSEIVVMKEVRVRSPYHSDCVVGGTAASNDRVKKVLLLERVKLKLSSFTGGNWRSLFNGILDMELTKLLVAALADDAELRTEAVENILQLQEEDLGLADILPITKDNEKKWISMHTTFKSQIKIVLLASLASSAAELGNCSSAQAIAEISAIELPENQWPELVPILLENLTKVGTPFELKHRTMETLGSICRNLCLEEDIWKVCDAVCNVASSSEEAELTYVAVNCLISFVSTGYGKLGQYMEEFADIAVNAIKTEGDNGLPLQAIAFWSLICEKEGILQELDSLIDAFQIKASDGVISFWDSYFQVDTEKWNTVRQEALFACSVIDKVMKFLECDSRLTAYGAFMDYYEAVKRFPENVDLFRSHSAFISRALLRLVPTLLEALLKQEEEKDQSDDVWNVSVAAASCLGRVCIIARDVIFPQVAEFIVANISDGNLRSKKAAILASRILSTEITKLLVDAQDMDTKIHTSAETSLLQLEEQDLARFRLSLSIVLVSECKASGYHRVAGILLKRSLHEKWISMETRLKFQIKILLLASLASSAAELRYISAMIIASVAAIELPQKQWPELVPNLIENLTKDGTPVLVKCRTLVTLQYICKDLCYEDLLKACEAVCEVAASSEAAETRYTAFHCLDAFVETNHRVIGQYMDRFVEIGLNAITSEDGNDLPYRAIGFWRSICYNVIELQEHENSITAFRDFWSYCDESKVFEDPETGDSSHHHSAMIFCALPRLVPTLLEVRMQQVRMQQEEDIDQGEEDVWFITTCLGLVGKVVGNAIVPVVTTFVEASISGPQWRSREAAAYALGSIVGGPTADKLAPLVSANMKFLVDTIKEQDENTQLRFTTAWTLSRIFKFFSSKEMISSLLSKVPDLLVDITKAVKDCEEAPIKMRLVRVARYLSNKE